MQSLILRLKEKYYYSEDSKSCLRFTSNSRKPFKEAGSIDIDTRQGLYKRWRVVLDCELFLAHRVVWLILNGEIPDGYEVDHVDGNALNNNISNLRLVTKAQNRRNSALRKDNPTGYAGVSDRGGSFVAIVKINKKASSKSFSKKKYGNEAISLAIAWRKEMIEMLNAQGAGYTDRHGT